MKRLVYRSIGLTGQKDDDDDDGVIRPRLRELKAENAF